MPLKRITRARKRLGGVGVDVALTSLATLGKRAPRARQAFRMVEVLRNLAYRDTGLRAHTLDVYRPRERSGPLPACLYIHGGGFRILSKDTHWMMGLQFALRGGGHVVFNANYRLAPAHPYPAAVEDVVDALLWVMANAERFGADPTRIVLAGESAGGNLVTTLVTAARVRRPEALAQRVFEAAPAIEAVFPACAMLQVSDPAHIIDRKPHMSTFIADRITEVSEAYLEGTQSPGLADPLCILEGIEAPDRPLPPCLAVCGTRDPLLDQTRRLGKAWARLGGDVETHIYPGGIHAFHALALDQSAKDAWRRHFDFLERIRA